MAVTRTLLSPAAQRGKEISNRMKRTAIDRRQFLKRGATLGMGTLILPAFLRKGWAASKDRVVIFQGVSLDSLHPYAYSGGGIVGIGLHMVDTLVPDDVGGT